MQHIRNTVAIIEERSDKAFSDDWWIGKLRHVDMEPSERNKKQPIDL